MSEINWQTIWQQAQNHSYERVVLNLMLLNGLTIEQIRQLPDSVIDLTEGWLTTPEGVTFPLVTQAIEALSALYADTAIPELEALEEACQRYTTYEQSAHRRLSGAIWITNDELQVMLETTGSAETPILPLRFTFPFSILNRLQPFERSTVADHAREVLQAAADWLVEQTLVSRSLISRVLGLLRQGSLIFLIASTGVSGLNLIHNVVMGRLLSPADYSQLTFIITLQLLVGLLPATIQTVTARFSVRYHTQNSLSDLLSLKTVVSGFSWKVGGATAVLLLLFAPLLVNLFQLNGVSLLLPIVIMMPFFIHTGVDRGFLQGLGAYFWLSGVYLSEGVIRLVLSALLGYALLEVGRSLEGAIWGLAQSMLATWFIGWLALRHFYTEDIATSKSNSLQSDWLRLGSMTALMLVGQAFITNSDFLLVKNFFSPEEAGLYAAISVLGRIVYFGALPLTVVLVPLIARRQALDEPTRPILMLLIGGGGIICTLLVIGAALFASPILTLLYGDAYVSAASLLAPYALAASLYTLTNLVITYQIALGHGSETWMPIMAGIAQIVAVILLHNSLTQVIIIQIVLMGVLFVMVLGRVLRVPTIQPEPLITPVEG